MRTITVDLKDEARKIRTEQVQKVEEAQEDLIQKLREEFEDYEDVPREYEQRYDRLTEREVDLRGRADALDRAVEEWDGGEFVLTELTTGQIADIQDSVSEKSFDFDPESGEVVDGNPKEGYGMVETLRQCIKQQPGGAPTRKDDLGQEVPDPAEYPNQVGLFLFEKANVLNTVGEADLGNSSLRERMKESPASSGS